VSGAIGDGGNRHGLYKVDTGTAVLTAANTYSGGTNIWNGKLSAASAGALGSVVATGWRGGTLNVNGVTLANSLSLAGSGASGTGAPTRNAIRGASGALTLASAALLGGTGTLTVSGA
ncbi:autotransporter-associated beta strand repeat-containing protein, partial [Methylobacterium sp. J-070]|uniref:autotransporter-associated beta strand repeat-containing protein n=1 Tax=Methylobacterium sp. J-070 TaxID=2836650 RepID=UPI001FB93B6E